MNLPCPKDAVRSVQPPKGMEPGRFANRYRHYRKLIGQNPNRDRQRVQPRYDDRGVPGSNAKDQSRAWTDKLQEMKHYGLHRHFTGGTSVAMFGGWVKKGFLYGKTTDERPLVAVENPVPVMDLHATIFTAMGISPKTAYDVEKRPFFATKDGHRKPVLDVFA
jgi:hypothetical protein